VLRYYSELLRDAPEVLLEAANRWLAIIGLLAALLLAVGAIRDDSISPLLILVPVALLVVWGMLRANWERYEEAKLKADGTDQAQQLAELYKEELQNAKRELAVSQSQYEVFKDFYKEQGLGG
jgi:hypothetical protein